MNNMKNMNDANRHSMNRHSRAFWVFSGVIGFLATAAVFSTLAMLLWNALLPELFALPMVSWLQSAGIFILCRVLFGGMTSGFRGGIFDRGAQAKGNFRSRWDAMTDEQRARFAEEIQKHHHGFDPRFAGFAPYSQNEQNEQKKPAEEKKDE
ncbi:MAG: hypothetical protein Ta2A_17230 [Treponemataceae bacterium]|nr:MAG: hypothetical protein Ta2A_17230 [Treponemataceae bacterium]